MKDRLPPLLILGLSAFGTSTSALAESEGSARMRHRLSVSATLAGQPYFSAFGGMLGYQIVDFLKVHAGYGIVPPFSTGLSGATASVSAATIGGGIKLYVPNWGFSPYVGLHLGRVTLDGSLTYGGISISASAPLIAVSMDLGIEWQTGYGLHFGIGLTKGLSGIPTARFLPGAYLGWSF